MPKIWMMIKPELCSNTRYLIDRALFFCKVCNSISLRRLLCMSQDANYWTLAGLFMTFLLIFSFYFQGVWAEPCFPPEKLWLLVIDAEKLQVEHVSFPEGTFLWDRLVTSIWQFAILTFPVCLCVVLMFLPFPPHQNSWYTRSLKSTYRFLLMKPPALTRRPDEQGFVKLMAYLDAYVNEDLLYMKTIVPLKSAMPVTMNWPRSLCSQQTLWAACLFPMFFPPLVNLKLSPSCFSPVVVVLSVKFYQIIPSLWRLWRFHFIWSYFELRMPMAFAASTSEALHKVQPEIQIKMQKWVLWILAILILLFQFGILKYLDQKQ